MIYYEDNYLMHHGIKGQKWGSRRWQNSDGTFNEAGKARYFGKSSGGNARRALAGVYGMNERVYSKLGNKTLASMNKAAKEEQLKKAAAADQARAAKKEATAKAKAEAFTKAVDVSKAKNSATKRVANDYHNLSEKEFRGKYQTTKKTFAKRYQKTDGDTYSLGKKKQALAVAFLDASKGKSMARTVADIAKMNALSDAEQRALDKGHKFTAGVMSAARDMSARRL